MPIKSKHLWYVLLKSLHAEYQRRRQRPVVVPGGAEGRLVVMRSLSHISDGWPRRSPAPNLHHQVWVLHDGRVLRELAEGDHVLREFICRGKQWSFGSGP